MDQTAHEQGDQSVLRGERAGQQRHPSGAGAPAAADRHFLLRFLPSDVYATLHSFLDAQHGACGRRIPISTDELRREMRLLADEARRRDTPVEQVIVLLKREWAALAQAERGDAAPRAKRDGERRVSPAMVSARAVLLERLVRLLIEEYYGS